MFRVLLIIGLLIAGVQQGFARGAVDVSKDDIPTIVSLDHAVAQLTAGVPDEEQSLAETKPSFCKNSECKAVMASASAVSLAGQDHPDWIAPGHQASVQKRLEPKPPNS